MQGSSIPVGNVMVWPTANWKEDMKAAGYNPNSFLECNGQTVDSTKYPKLAKIMNKTPNYQGLFLRGHGSQAYTDNYDFVKGAVNHSSGNIGEIQGDTIRNITAMLGQQQFSEWNGGADIANYGHSNNVFYYDYSSPYPSPPKGMASYPRSKTGFRDNSYASSSPTDLAGGWYDALTRYKYSLSGDPESGYTLTETVEHPMLDFEMQCMDFAMDLSLAVPTANENRPVNTAVVYLISAR